MKSKSINLIAILLATFFITYFSGCLKNDSTSPLVPITKQSTGATTGNKTSDSSIANQLIADYSAYDMQYLDSNQIAGIHSMRSFYFYDSAKNYIDSFINVLSTPASSANDLSKNVMKSNNPYVQAPDCAHGGLFHAVFGSSAPAGLLSHFEAYITTTSSGISNMSIYSVGTPIGWSWNQMVQTNSGYSGCTAGTVVFGITIGNIVLGFTENFHFNYYMDAQNCLIYPTEGLGPCY